MSTSHGHRGGYRDAAQRDAAAPDEALVRCLGSGHQGLRSVHFPLVGALAQWIVLGVPAGCAIVLWHLVASHASFFGLEALGSWLLVLVVIGVPGEALRRRLDRSIAAPCSVVAGHMLVDAGRWWLVDGAGARHRVVAQACAQRPRIGECVARIHSASDAVVAWAFPPTSDAQERDAAQAALDVALGVSAQERVELVRGALPRRSRARLARRRPWTLLPWCGRVRHVGGFVGLEVRWNGDHSIERAMRVGRTSLPPGLLDADLLRSGDVVRACHVDGQVLAVEVLGLVGIDRAAECHRAQPVPHDTVLADLRASFHGRPRSRGWLRADSLGADGGLHQTPRRRTPV